MNLTIYPTAGEFLSAARTALEQNEAANNLMYGLALRAEQYPERIKSPHFYAAVHQGEDLLAAASMTPPHNLVVFSTPPDPPEAAFVLIAEYLQREQWPVPGVLGPNAAALAFAQAWQAAGGASARLTVHERIYELRQVLPHTIPPGQMRLAAPQDLDLITAWLIGFYRDANLDERPTLAEARDISQVRIEDGSFYLWEDGGPVSLAGWTRPTPHGCCIGPVYTPAEYRAKGYATALTAALSQLLLNSGKQFTELFTDLANPTSNSIYQKIGYRRVCEFDQYRFEK